MQSKIYRITSATKSTAVWGLIGGILMSAVTTYAALFAQPRDRSQMPALLLCLVLGYVITAFFAWLRYICSIRLEVTETQIIQHAPRRPPSALDWSEITNVKNNTAMQRLELRSNAKGRAIMVEHQIENFDELRQIIEVKTGCTIS